VNAQRRTALVSVGAACALIALKLAAGIPSGSLGLVAEALHSGTDLIAALLTFFAIGVSGRPADEQHQYGHGKAEHLAALFEASVLAVVSIGVAGLAVARLAGWVHIEVDPRWYAFLVVGLVLAIDVARTVVSLRTARRFHSAALLSNAVHFGSDFAGSLAVLLGLIAARAGWAAGDSVAALFVAVLVLSAALRLMRRNVDVLMDRAPAGAEEAARAAIAGIEPAVILRRLRIRSAAGRHFADVVIAVSPGAAVGQGHAAADRVEEAIQRALPETDVVVHVEPGEVDAVTRELAQAAALRVPRVREIHNITATSRSTRRTASRTRSSRRSRTRCPASTWYRRTWSRWRRRRKAAAHGAPRSRATRRRSPASSARGRARRRASCASCRPKTASSSSSPSGSTRPHRSRKRTRAPARSKRRSGPSSPRSPS
jgi:cation diffusion facilitator family transporter